MKFCTRTLLEWFVAGFWVVLIMSAIMIGPVVSMLTEHKDTTRKEVNVVEVQQAQENKLLYDRGVNSALDALILLNLEQQLQGTNRTWGEMADMVRQRLNVEVSR
jgi:uncharacterized membrane protein YdfJ with MMPL/SSD domain